VIVIFYVMACKYDERCIILSDIKVNTILPNLCRESAQNNDEIKTVVLHTHLVTHCQTLFNRKTACDCKAEMMAFNAEKFFRTRHSCNKTCKKSQESNSSAAYTIQLYHLKLHKQTCKKITQEITKKTFNVSCELNAVDYDIWKLS